MQSAPLHPQEQARLQELIRLEVLDSEDEDTFDELTQLASSICGTRISLISLVDYDRQWFKSRVGLDATETHRDLAFCAHAILQEAVFEVPDTLQDERFADNPLVLSNPDIRFYAGMPLVTKNGLAIGTLCVIDTVPNKLTPDQAMALKVLAKQVVGQLELRVQNRQLKRLQKQQEQLFSVVGHDLRAPFNGILGLSKILQKSAGKVTPERLTIMANGILESSMNVYQLLDELLQWSRSHLGAITVATEPLHLKPLVQETLNFMQDSFTLKNISVTQQIDETTVALIDGSLFKTIARNLLANAIKYTNENGLIHIEANAQGNNIELTITDNGIGVPAHIIDSIFIGGQDSQQGTQGETGNGLGLSLCVDFARRLSGALTLDKNYKDGARFVLTLPAGE